MAKYKIRYRYTERIQGYSLSIRISYKCPNSKRTWFSNGYSNVYPINPFTDSDLYEKAHFQAIASAKKTAVCKYNMVQNLKVIYEYLIIWKIQDKTTFERNFTPDLSYAKAEKKYGKNFIPEKDYYFLKKYYNYDMENMTEKEQSRRIKLIIKYKKVIDEWPTRETRRAHKKLREEVGE